MSLARNFATVASSTMSSRLLGFVRDMFMAAALGTGPVADAFLVAFRLPNLFRRLFAEGAFSAAFIPLFARRLEESGDEAAHRFAGEVLSAFALLLVIVTIVGEIFMSPIIGVLAPGFAADPEKFALAILLTRIALPYLALISLLALYSGVLNAHGRFLAAAMAPALLNVVLVGALAYVIVTGRQDTEQAGILLAVATLVGGLAQLLMVVVATRRAGIDLPLLRPRLTAGVRRLTALAVPGLIGGGVTQINIVIGTMIASFAPGAIAVLGYADRLYQLPLGIVGATIAVVVLPDLSRQLRAGRADLAAALQNRSVEFSMALTLPAAAGLFALAEPIVRIIYERGAFDAADTLVTARTLMGFALGLPAFVLIKALSPAYFAREDTKTPMWFAAIAVAINVAGSLALFPVLSEVGIALATSLSAWVNAGLLGGLLLVRGHWQPDARLRRSALLLIVATAAMTLVARSAAALAEPLLRTHGGLIAALTLAAICLGAAVLYAMLCQFARIVDFSELIRVLRARQG
ncbi:murein biosynthesis integral membrane protein MurJ [Kaistia algarum]|uniref:murein biosynthesis integral membrane protein MurJ n=1 Tax=Kaistia algarum TaxID=2083279 RepID=UPI000CE7B012|nr:murein biosynthesis integral membrane protein MurJ [Kaistia algarum]MCX5513805.1 murein biosynthesis integral membrane protein MurJ [Kaistia algarum]PPE79329.1 murein biosynthesis integral membrane protein MurJ [Kaistia algarum]